MATPTQRTNVLSNHSQASVSNFAFRCFLAVFVISLAFVSADMLLISPQASTRDTAVQAVELIQHGSVQTETSDSVAANATSKPLTETPHAEPLSETPVPALEPISVSVSTLSESPRTSIEPFIAIPAPIVEASTVTPSEAQFVQDLWLVSQQEPQQPRGLVIPLYEGITVLGKTLILELRLLGVDLPIEIPYCGDLPETHQTLLAQDDPLVRIYNVCELAERAATSLGKLFCRDKNHCHRFRSFYIKPLSIVFSRFQEIMLLDADTIHFRSPMSLWETDKYNITGTLFFHDRVSWELEYLDSAMPGQTNVTRYQHFMAKFNVAPFRSLARIPRKPASYLSAPPVTLPFEPSEFLLNSHTWNRRAGMEMESSLVLWNKARQPRATAILASFISVNQTETPPSYGDKEYFFIACELAETAYSFSDFGVGVAGWDLRTIHEEASGYPQFTVCGEILQFYPERQASDGDDPAALEALPQFMNGDPMFTWNPDKTSLYRAKARSADFYVGYKQPQYCPFNITIIPFKLQEDNRLRERQALVKALREILEAMQTGNVSSPSTKI